MGPTDAVFLLQFSTVFTILFGIAVLKEKFTLREAAGVLLAVVSVFILAYGNLTVQAVGLVVLIGVALFSALASLACCALSFGIA